MEIEHRIEFDKPNMAGIPEIIDEVVKGYVLSKGDYHKVTAWELESHCSDGCYLKFGTEVINIPQIFLGREHRVEDITYEMVSVVYTNSKEECDKLINYLHSHVNTNCGMISFEVGKGLPTSFGFSYWVSWTARVDAKDVRNIIMHSGNMYG